MVAKMQFYLILFQNQLVLSEMESFYRRVIAIKQIKLFENDSNSFIYFKRL